VPAPTAQLSRSCAIGAGKGRHASFVTGSGSQSSSFGAWGRPNGLPGPVAVAVPRTPAADSYEWERAAVAV
jgi:hypothetical protein